MRVFEWIAGYIKRFPWQVIIACLVLTAFLGSGVVFLKGQLNYTSFLPKGFDSIKALSDLNAKFAGISYETVLILAPDVTDNRITQFLIGLEDYINQSPGLNKGQVQEVPGQEGSAVPPILRQPTPIVQNYLSPFIANVKAGIAQSGFNINLSGITNEIIKAQTGKDFHQTVIEDYLSVPEVRQQMVGKQKFILYDAKTGRYPAATVMLKTGANLTDIQQIQLANDLEKVFRSKIGNLPGVRLYFTGDPTLARDFNTHIRDKTMLLGLIAVVFVVLIIFLAFRRWSDALMTLGVVILGVLWTFGATGWLHIPYSVAAIAIMPLLLGHALTFVVPFTARYYEEMEHYFRSVQMVGVALVSVGVAIFLMAITSILGFLVFEFSVLPPLKDFGLTSAIGTFFAFVLTVVLLPALMVVRDRSHEKGPAEEREKAKTHFDGLTRKRKRGFFARGTDSGLEWFTSLAVKHWLLVVIVGTILMLIGFASIRNLKTDSDLRKLVPGGLPNIKADTMVEKYFGGQQTDTIMITGDVLDPQNLAAIKRLEEGVLKDPLNKFKGSMLYPADAVNSLPDALSSANNNVLPQTREQAEAAINSAQSNGGFIVGGLVSSDRKAALLTLNGMGAQTTQVINRKLQLLNEQSRKELGPTGLRYQLGGITALTKDLTKNIIPTETWSSLLSLGLCGLLLMIIFRSVPFGMITLTVAFAGVAAEIGFLSAIGFPLDVVTSLSSALVIGIGSNFGILFTHRYIQEMNKGEDLPAEAIRASMFSVGRANVVAAIATVGAFLIVLLSGIVPLVRFAGATAFGVGMSLIAALTYMPALLFRLSSHRRVAIEDAAVNESPA